MQARGHVEVGHHCLGNGPIGEDVHVAVLGAKLHRAPGHGLYLANESLPAGATAQVAGDLDPVPLLEGGIQVEGDAGEEVAQHLLKAEAHHGGGDGASTQKLAQADLQHIPQDSARSQEVEGHHQQVPSEAWCGALGLAQQGVQQEEGQQADAQVGRSAPEDQVRCTVGHGMRGHARQ